MKLKTLTLLTLALLIFSSCSKEEEDLMTEADLIAAIEAATDKQTVEVATLPEQAQTTLTRDYSESEAERALLARDLGYALNMRRMESSRMGERNRIYFSLEGRLLRRNKERKMERGENGCDREKCFEFVFPISFIMPDGTEISGDGLEVRTGITAWYDANPGVEERPELRYPLDIVFSDDTTVTLENNEQMRRVYNSCHNSGNETFDCPRSGKNIGDPCRYRDENRIVLAGTVRFDCECQ
jgi:uncharacterized protein YcfL